MCRRCTKWALIDTRCPVYCSHPVSRAAARHIWCSVCQQGLFQQDLEQQRSGFSPVCGFSSSPFLCRKRRVLKSDSDGRSIFRVNSIHVKPLAFSGLPEAVVLVVPLLIQGAEEETESKPHACRAVIFIIRARWSHGNLSQFQFDSIYMFFLNCLLNWWGLLP